MSDDNERTTVILSKEASRLLGRVSKAYQRSKTKQVEYMIEVEARKLAEVKLLPESEDSETEESRAYPDGHT